MADQQMQRHHMRAILGTGLLVIFAAFAIMWLKGEATNQPAVPAPPVKSTAWERFGSDHDGEHFFKVDESSPSPGIERVWTHLVFSETGRKNYIEKRRQAAMSLEGYDQLSDRDVLYEINCFSANREIRIVEVLEKTRDGKTLDSARAGSYKDWSRIPPGSVYETLCNRVCPAKKE